MDNNGFYSNPRGVVKPRGMCYHQVERQAACEVSAAMTTAQTLEAFLATVRDAREYRRALIVQLCERGQQQAEVARLLQVSEAFVSTCRKKYAQDGLASFALGYQGGGSFLSAEERADVLAWLAEQKRPNVKALYGYLKDSFGVVYETRQSYYNLLKQAGQSHKKTQISNPQKTKLRSRPNGPS